VYLPLDPRNLSAGLNVINYSNFGKLVLCIPHCHLEIHIPAPGLLSTSHSLLAPVGPPVPQPPLILQIYCKRRAVQLLVPSIFVARRLSRNREGEKDIGSLQT
jgi:hypothetical protein